MSRWTISFLAPSLWLLGAALPTHVVAAPRDDDGRAVPTRIHDRARAEGQVRVLVELSLPSGHVTEGALSSQARTAYRHEITDTASRVLRRLARHPHGVLRQYPTAPLIALEVGPAALQELEAASFLVKRVVEDRLHPPGLVDSVPLIGAAHGSGTPSEAIWGVGRGASIMAVQIFSRFTRSADCGGAPPCIRAYTSDILAALERVYVLRTTHGFSSVSMSL